MCFGVKVHFHLAPGSAYLFAIISLPVSLRTPASHQLTVHRLSIYSRSFIIAGVHFKANTALVVGIVLLVFLLHCFH